MTLEHVSFIWTVSNNADSVSPSVYIAFISLYATDDCGKFGSVPATTTMAFDAHEITTLWYEQIPYQQMPSCLNGAYVLGKTTSRVMTWSDLLSGCELFAPGVSYDPDFPDANWITNGRCIKSIRDSFDWLIDITRPVSPSVSLDELLSTSCTFSKQYVKRGLIMCSIAIPTKLIKEHPELASCTPWQSGGFYDPPKTLHPGAMLVPTTLNTMAAITSSAIPLPRSSLPTATHAFQENSRPSNTNTVALSASASREIRNPMATLVYPPPLILNPNEDIVVLEPGQPPRLNTLINPQIIPRPKSSASPALVSAQAISDLVEHGAPTLKPTMPVFTFNNEVVTVGTARQFVISGLTLIPGGAITVNSASISLDMAGSFVVIDATSTVIFGRTSQTPTANSFDDSVSVHEATLIFGGTTRTNADGQLSIFGGTTTIVPAHTGSREKDPYTLLRGTITTHRDGQVTAVGGITTTLSAVVAYHTTLITLTMGGKTIKLPNSAIAVIRGSITVIAASITSSGKSLTLTYGRTILMLSNGRISVIGGTRTVVAVPRTTAGARTTTTGVDGNTLQDKKSLSYYGKSTMRKFDGDERPVRSSTTINRQSNCGRVRMKWFNLFLIVSVLSICHPYP